MRVALAAMLALAGCLEVPKPKGQECAVDSDCNTAIGEVCGDGVCWGGPPAGTYAATLSAPVERQDVIATELPLVELPRGGNLGALELETPVTISGRVEAACGPIQMNCSTSSIAARIRITRPSRFPGGPTLRFLALSKSGVPRGTDSFTIRVPRTGPDDPPYTVTIDPEGGGDAPPPHGGKDPAQLVPPKRFELAAAESIEHQTYTLGTNAVQISGTLKDSLGASLTKYRVVAVGRWQGSSNTAELSSVHYSTDGTYSISLAEGVTGTVELVAKPYDMQVAPELHVTGVEPTGPQTRNIFQPTGIGARIDVSIPIEGLSGNGEVRPVSGARVIVTGSTASTFTSSARAVVVAEAITMDDGIARFSLLDGDALAGSYRLRVVPPASSSFGVIYDQPLQLGALTKVRLPSRIAVRGSVVDIAGLPLADVSVTARRSLRFLWSLDAPDQAFLDEIPAATAITPESGEFVMWLDPAIGSVWGHYDLFFETPDNSPSPSWSIADLEIPRIPGQMTISLATVTIPDAAHMRGRVVDGAGIPVAGSALRIFQISDNESLCGEVSYAPAGCAADARAMGHGESDGTGMVRFTLPRP